MCDLGLAFTSEGIDLDFKKGDLVLENALTTAALISLFTDASNPQNINETGIWWGNNIGKDVRPLGSKLWMLQRASLSDQALEQARFYALESLQWLLEDSLAMALDVQVAPISAQGLLLQIKVDEQQPMQIQWEPSQGYITVLNHTSSTKHISYG